jgi:hypothetical protein
MSYAPKWEEQERERDIHFVRCFGNSLFVRVVHSSILLTLSKIWKQWFDSQAIGKTLSILIQGQLVFLRLFKLISVQYLGLRHDSLLPNFPLINTHRHHSPRLKRHEIINILSKTVLMVRHNSK